MNLKNVLKQCKIQVKIISVGTKWYGKNDI